MKKLYNKQELSDIVNRLARRTPTTGAVAVVPDLIAVTVVPGVATVLALPAGKVDHFHSWLEFVEDVDKKVKKAKMTFWSGDVSHTFNLKEGLDDGRGMISLKAGPLYVTIEDPNVKTVALTIHYSPVVSDRELKSIALIDPSEVLP